MRSVRATLVVATALLVPGSLAADDAHNFDLVSRVWHEGAVWNPVIKGPEQKSFEAIAVNLSGRGANADRTDVISGERKSALRKVVKNIDDSIILDGDSAVGALCQESAGDVAPHLEVVVFHNTFLIKDTTSLADNMIPDIVRVLTETATVFSDKSLSVNRGICRHVLVAGVLDYEGVAIIDTTVPHPFGFRIYKVDKSSFAEVSTFHFVLLTTEDKLFLNNAWAGMAMWLGNPIMVDVTSGHEVLLTHPDVAADGLSRIAAMLH